MARMRTVMEERRISCFIEISARSSVVEVIGKRTAHK
jgi:hypothetical protein